MKTLLVLDDEEVVMKLLRHALREYNMLEASTAEQALRIFLDVGHHVDLLISDVTLPKSSGVHVAVLMREQLRDLPVILTSGYPPNAWSRSESADSERLGQGSVTFLQKPFKMRELTNVVLAAFSKPKTMKAGSSYLI